MTKPVSTTVEIEPLARALRAIRDVPYLGNQVILAGAADNKLYVAGQSRDDTARMALVIPATAELPRVTVAYELFTALVGLLPGKTCTLTVTDRSVRMAAEATQYEIPIALEEPRNQTPLELTGLPEYGPGLLPALRFAKHSTNSKDPATAGVYLCGDGDELVVYGRDHKRCAIAVLPHGPDWLPQEDLMLSLLAVELALNLATATVAPEMTLAVSPTRVEFFTADGSTEAPLREGSGNPTLVKIRALLNEPVMFSVTLPREALLAAVQRASIAADTQYTIWLGFSPGRLDLDVTELANNRPGSVTAHEELACAVDQTYQVGPNPWQLIEGLLAFTGETVTLDVRDKFAPVVVRDGNHLLMLTVNPTRG